MNKLSYTSGTNGEKKHSSKKGMRNILGFKGNFQEYKVM
jgi:hypothetical protein